MSSRHYYYPTTSNGRSKVVDRDRVFDRDHDRASRYDSSDHSDAPSLSRASTPSTLSSPPTPTLSPVMPTDSKMRGRHVEFASPVSHAYRRAEHDELSTMRAFASHTSHCESCDHSLSNHRAGSRLCDRGTGLAKNLGAYFYCFDGKPHSNNDRRRGMEKVQVEVPVEYGSVKGLFEALDKGLDLKRPRAPKPEVHQSSYPTMSPRPLNSHRHTMDSYPSQNHRRFLDREDYDIRPARSDSRRLREPVYRNPGGRYVDTKPSYHEEFADRRRPRTPPTPLTPRTPLSNKYLSGITDSDLHRLSDDIDRRRSRVPTTPLTSRTPLSSKYSSDISDSDLRRLSNDIDRRRSRRLSDTRERSRYDDRPSRVPRRRDSFDDRFDRRRGEDRRRRSSERYYSSDDEYRKPKRSSSYFPFSIWR